MFLNDTQLRAWASGGGLTPYAPECINPASVDLRWSGRYRLAYPEGWGVVVEAAQLTMRPGQLFLLDTLETITIPDNTCGWLALKSSIGRMGLEHLHAGFFDPGFHGTGTLEMENRAPWVVTISIGQRIIQLALADVAIPERTYQVTGRYNGQSAPQPAKG